MRPHFGGSTMRRGMPVHARLYVPFVRPSRYNGVVPVHSHTGGYAVSTFGGEPPTLGAVGSFQEEAQTLADRALEVLSSAVGPDADKFAYAVFVIKTIQAAPDADYIRRVGSRVVEMTPRMARNGLDALGEAAPTGRML